MHDDLATFEDELRKLRPAAVSEQLETRVASMLEANPPSVIPWWQRLGFNRPAAAFGWGLVAPALTVAAVIATIQVTGFQRPPVHPASGQRQTAGNEPAPGAVRASNVLYQTQDDGVVLDGSQEPVRRVRYRSTDLVRWRNPTTGARWEVSYPREDVALVPVHVD